MKKLLCLILALSATSFADPNVSNSNSTPSSNSTTSTNNNPQFNFFFNNETLANSLRSFAKNNGLQISISRNLTNEKLNTKIKGRFVAKTLNDFINSMAQQYGFNWFVYSGVLYITSLKQVTTGISVAPDAMNDIKEYLAQIGLLDPRFGYSELRSQNKIFITGPQEYIDLIGKQIHNLNYSRASGITQFSVNDTNEQVGVYRLKYASVDDVELNFNNQTILIPGVVSILQNLFAGGNNPSKTQITENVSVLLKNQNSSAPNKNSNTNQSFARASDLMPSIQADSRLNTIIVRDKSTNLQLYKNIISQLDVPAPLIQIEVMIIRLDQDNLSQAGVNWWGTTGGGNNAVSGGFGGSNIAVPSNALAFSFGQVNPGQLIVTNMASFISNLQFLENNKSAQTQAKPSLATIDNLPAVISLTDNIYNVTNGTNTGNNSNNGATSGGGIQIIQSLQITPHVIAISPNENQIKLTMVLQDGAINPFSNNTVMPNYSQSYLSSQAVIKEGQSIILAGYTKDTAIKREYKVPGLGDIPVLGWLFKTTSLVNHKITTLYVVTPKIIWPSELNSLGNATVESGTKGNKIIKIKNTFDQAENKNSSSPIISTGTTRGVITIKAIDPNQL